MSSISLLTTQQGTRQTDTHTRSKNMAGFPPAQPAVFKSLARTLTWRTLRWRRHHMCGRRGSSAPGKGRWPPRRSWSTSLWRTAAKRRRRSVSRRGGVKIQEVWEETQPQLIKVLCITTIYFVNIFPQRSCCSHHFVTWVNLWWKLCAFGFICM